MSIGGWWDDGRLDGVPSLESTGQVTNKLTEDEWVHVLPELVEDEPVSNLTLLGNCVNLLRVRESSLGAEEVHSDLTSKNSRESVDERDSRDNRDNDEPKPVKYKRNTFLQAPAPHTTINHTLQLLFFLHPCKKSTSRFSFLCMLLTLLLELPLNWLLTTTTDSCPCAHTPTKSYPYYTRHWLLFIATALPIYLHSPQLNSLQLHCTSLHLIIHKTQCYGSSKGAWSVVVDIAFSLRASNTWDVWKVDNL
jgi:hypothetical protein